MFEKFSDKSSRQKQKIFMKETLQRKQTRLNKHAIKKSKKPTTKQTQIQWTNKQMNEKRKIKSLPIITIKLFDDFQELKKKLNFKYAQGKK